MGRKRPQILIADDHRLVGDAYKGILEPENEVVGVVDDGQALLREANRLNPQVVIADIAMPVLNGLDAAQQLKLRMPGIKIIFVTMNQDEDLIAEAFRRGASAYLPKTVAGPELLQAVREVVSGRSYLSPIATRATISSLLRREKSNLSAADDLTGRQREVIQLLAEGKSMKEAASLLNMTVRTVAFHKYRIMKKLDLRSSAELVQYAMRNHIIAA